MNQTRNDVDRYEMAIQSDTKFFERFPDRNHRIRPASQAELDANDEAFGRPKTSTTPGCRWFVAVKQIAPGVRIRTFVENDCAAEWDLSEDQAQKIYLAVAGPNTKTAEIEQRLLVAMAARGVK